MPRPPGIHVVPDKDNDGQWVILIARDFDTKEHAEATARLISGAVDGELHLHGEDGQIQEKDSHGNDPPEIPG